MRQPILLLLILFINTASFSQVDSLLSEYNKLNQLDSTKLKLGVSIWRSLGQNDISEQLVFSKKFYADFKNHDSARFEFEALNKLGISNARNGDFENCKIAFKGLLELDTAALNSGKIGDAYNNLGILYMNLGETDSSLYNYLEGLKHRKRTNDPNIIFPSYTNIGLLYYRKNEFEKALSYYNEGYEIMEKVDNVPESAILRLVANMGLCYGRMGKYKLAHEKSKEALDLAEIIGYPNHIMDQKIELGNILILMGRIREAEPYIQSGYDISVEIHDTIKMYYALDNLGTIAGELGNHSKAFEIYKNSLTYYESIGDLYKMKGISLSAATAAYKAKKYKESSDLIYFHMKYKDSLFSQDNEKATLEMETKFQTEKKELELEQEKIKNEKNRALLKTEKTQRYLLYGGIGSIMVVAGFVLIGYYRKKKDNQIIQEQKEQVVGAYAELHEKNQEILDSITYAKRIQSAILPSDKVVREYLKESFIFYQPKDIVAGDFYWMESVTTTSNNEPLVLFAAADCTGHGVPGAMVSVVCNNGLNRSVREHRLTDPGEILSKTREIIVNEFEKSDEDVRDGMDIALCSLIGNKLEYAGANNPLWIIRDGALMETKGNKQPIGKFDNPLPYTTHSFTLQKGDTIYIFSDGFVDQFGGDKGKKFKAKAFRELLLSIQNESMSDQKNLLAKAFETWMGDLDQIDDVCVIGLRI